MSLVTVGPLVGGAAAVMLGERTSLPVRSPLMSRKPSRMSLPSNSMSLS